MVFENLLNPIFSPLLNIPTLWAVLFLSFMISLLITLVYKYTTDQNLMKQLKDEMKEFQKQIKELKKEPEKAMAVQKKAMQTNMKYMMQSMKSTLYSIIPIILIFGWMNAHFAFVPLAPNEEFATSLAFVEGTSGEASISVPEGMLISGSNTKSIENNEVTWLVRGEEGEYLLEYSFDGKKYSNEVIISKTEYKNPIKKIGDGVVETISIDLEKNIVLNLFGWKMGWLITYILSAIIFSMAIRKAVRVY